MIVHSMDRLARNLEELRRIVGEHSTLAITRRGRSQLAA